ncbi:dihydroorotate dehydrogenase-like protein [Roseospira marina]|uniref:Dihydroorotate dehydrogenase-like protein n=1 Tax=Roseospira marina TaxID=140057 RepID=A0A5M6ICS8_9PROT|nr:dihydroorotate dehydrogenase-like protein [Roseospira marina]KAA5606013.1 dihydroorotate dehydrogenase-like protein [Roseospira marina]MBB4313130.1 dihydroorotate dehydrogenase (fumarate) [Roseospira marina]MBB5086129.1 dihydroorotate dehydrogenase (fumarate) [Roseospira marina]
MDMTTRYLGLTLDHPIVASASPLSGTLDGIRRLEDAGAAAVILPSLFEERIQREREAMHGLSEVGAESHAEVSGGYFPAASMDDVGIGGDETLDLIRRARESCAIPVIPSLNGVSPRGWTQYARMMEEAGAPALELNVYYVAADLDESGAAVEARVESILQSVRQEVSIPVAVKLGPYFSAPGHMARRLVAAGASGLVLFNRFYQPEIDLQAMRALPTLDLSTSAEARLPLRWIGILYGHLDGASIAATTGVQGAEDAMKFILVGADVVMTASALLRYGPAHMKTLVSGLRAFLEVGGYDSIDQARGALSHRAVADTAAYERANYLQVLDSFRPSDYAP